jgi:TRAP-type C4-dicarboxylate transport system substrate-binding protein
MTFKTTRRTLLLAGTAASATIAMPWIARGAAEFQFKYANNSPVAHPLNIRAVEAMERIKQETNGRVEIQIFPNNQLGSDTDMLSQLRSGAIEFFYPVRADPLDLGAGRFHQRSRFHLGELR